MGRWGGGGLINFLPLKKGGGRMREWAYLRAGEGGLIEDLRYIVLPGVMKTGLANIL